MGADPKLFVRRDAQRLADGATRRIKCLKDIGVG